MRYLLPGLLLFTLCFSVFADSARDAALRQQIANAQGTSRAARIDTALSGPCTCSAPATLTGTDGLLFNCTCGSLQCAVVGSKRSVPGNTNTFELVCR